jgi:hypothetical protein
MRSILRHLSFANAMSVLAVFIALGSGAYAVVHVAKHSVGAPQLKKNAVREKKIANGAVKQNKLADGSVNGAKVADGSLGLADVNASLHQICPAGTVYLQGACIETAQRTPAAQFVDARPACGPSGRLPSIAELDSLGRRPGVSWSGFEWSSARYTDGGLPYVTTLNDSGGFGVNADSNSGFAPFRCVFEPTG